MALNMAEYEPPDFFEFEPYQFPPPPPYSLPPPSPPPPFSPPPHAVDDLKTALVAAAVFSLLFLIAKDAHKAFTRKAHWIPCGFLALSAFSIQMLTMLNIQNQEMAATSSRTNQHAMARWLISIKNSIAGHAAPGQYAARWKDFLMIHNSRTILCVFAAYVMPSMANRGIENSWVRWVSLVIIIFHHVTSEFYSGKVKSSDTPNLLRIWPEPYGGTNARYYVYATIISLCFILLVLLLASATIAGRSIERIVSQQIPLVLRGEGELSDTAEKTVGVHQHHHFRFKHVKFDVSRAGQHYHLRHDLHNESSSQGRGDEIQDESSSPGEKSDEGAAKPRGEEERRYRRHCHYCWGRVEDAVLKAWIIVRAYSVQPVLARSALTASAAVIVTIQILITIVGGLSKVLRKDNNSEKNTFKLVALAVQSLFILMAWALINLRWATAVAYDRNLETDSWRSGLKIEDFWTRHLRELLQREQSKLEEAESLDKEISQLDSSKKETPVQAVIQQGLLSLAIGLQLVLALFSKACWLLSLMIFHNKFMRKLFNFLFEKYILSVFEDYPIYEKMLKEVQMLGESPESLWVSNRKSIEEAKRLTIQGNQDGECGCEDLVEFLITNRTAQPHPDHFKYTLSWKMKAVSLLAVIFHLSKHNGEVKDDVKDEVKEELKKCVDEVKEELNDEVKKELKDEVKEELKKCVDEVKGELNKCVDEVKEELKVDEVKEELKKCVEVYCQAWEIIDFVDEAEADSVAEAETESVAKHKYRVDSEAADKYFEALQKKVSGEFDSSELEDLIEKERSGDEGNDSIDWKAAALESAVNNLWERVHRSESSSIQGNDVTDDVSILLKKSESSLADIINECLDKTQNLLLLKSRKWALHRNEKRLGKALYTAGKAKVIMGKLASNKLAIVSYP